MKQIKSNGVGSFDNFGLGIKKRNLSIPKKKKIQKSIPFANGILDFSNIDGEIYWEQRTIEYTFDISEWTTEEMNKLRDSILDWAMNIHESIIEDEFEEDYYFYGSYFDGSWSEDWGQGELSISFDVYPYKFAKKQTNITLIATEIEQEFTIKNESSHRIIPEIDTDVNIIIKINENSYDFNVGDKANSKFALKKGDNIWKIQSKQNTANINVSYRKEVF